MKVRRLRGYAIIAFLATLAVYQAFLGVERPAPEHMLTLRGNLLGTGWIRKGDIIGRGFVASGDALYFSAYTTRGDQLVAISPSTGHTLWSSELSGLDARAGIVRLTAEQDTVFATTAQRITTYDPLTGDERWSQLLGYGHVSVIHEVQEGVVLVYYGDSLIEVPRTSPDRMTSRPMGDLLWIIDDLEIHDAFGGMVAIDRRTHTPRWRTGQGPFVVSESTVPLPLPPMGLLVRQDRSTCNLDLEHGAYVWCVDGLLVNAAAVDRSTPRVLALDDQFNLISIDPVTGQTLTVAEFPGGILPSETNRGYVYSVAATPDRAYVYFGDSLQLFSLAIR